MARIILDPPKNGEILRNSELGGSGLRKKDEEKLLGRQSLVTPVAQSQGSQLPCTSM